MLNKIFVILGQIIRVLREICVIFSFSIYLDIYYNNIYNTNQVYICYKIIFTVEFNENYENLLDKLHEWGIGDRVGSTVSVMNCLVSKTFRREAEFDLPQENDDV